MTARTIRAEARTTIRRPVDAVFGWLTDPALLPRWVTGLVASRPEGADGLRVGARFVDEVVVRGKTVMMPTEIVELDAGRVIGSRIQTPEGPCLSRFVLDDRGNSCGVVHTFTVEAEGYRWVPTPLVAAAVAWQIRGDLARLTRLAEAAS